MSSLPLLEAVINISEGRDGAAIDGIAATAGAVLLDIHRDPDHHRAVLTLGGHPDAVEAGARAVARATVERLDLGRHRGAHPRIGTLDVVPFVALERTAGPEGRIGDGAGELAVAARDRFCAWAGSALHLPCFAYGPGQPTLPEVRRGAWRDLGPTTGPDQPHLRAGATAVGARPLLLAYNLWLREPDLDTARAIARDLRSEDVRALGLEVGPDVQVSCNLINPTRVGPGVLFDAVASRAGVDHAELVGLAPRAVLDAEPARRWSQLDLDPGRTIEARLEQAGLDGGSGGWS